MHEANRQRDERLREVLNEAAALPAAQRPEALDAACAGDSELRAQLESLLDALDGGTGFLENPTLHAGPDAARL